MQRRYPLAAFYIRSCVIGFALAAVFTTVLVATDVAHLRHLTTRVEGGYLAAVLLWFFNGIVFSGAQAAVSVLLMAERADRGGGTPEPAPPALPVRTHSRLERPRH